MTQNTQYPLKTAATRRRCDNEIPETDHENRPAGNGSGLWAQAALAENASFAAVGGKADDPFFAKVKNGIDAATLVVAAYGGTVNYLMLQNYDKICGDAANLVRTAIS
ncbi:hypothetical protein [Cypionkella sp. TWP1-2-1b2]|uniref:hypothetical protein n=1 Tax=Cypionkella sp. TWP1-2-1b2 TaxID=2804675 RepID=UPI003CFB3EB7